MDTMDAMKLIGGILICLASTAASADIPSVPRIEQEKPPTSTLQCNLIDAKMRTYKINLFSSWHPDKNAGGVEVISDETGTLPIGQFLKDARLGWNGPHADGRDHPGLEWGWRGAAFEARADTGALLYRVRLDRDGERGPLSETGTLVSISIIYWRKLEKKAGWAPGMLDQFLGFCTVDPPNQAVPDDVENRRPKLID